MGDITGEPVVYFVLLEAAVVVGIAVVVVVIGIVFVVSGVDGIVILGLSFEPAL